MRALSIRQPWAWLIVHGWKDIENRDWYTPMRRGFLVHAAKGMTRGEYEAARDFVIYDLCDRYDLGADFRFPDEHELERGGIVGEATIVDCVEASDSPWFFGRYGFVLRDAKPLPFQPCRGALGFF